MNRSRLILSTLALIGFIGGFFLTLAVHWQVRPVADQTYPLEEIHISSTMVPSLTAIEKTKVELKNIEDKLQKLNEEHRIIEGRARALVSEMQVYRQSESKLLQSIEQQNLNLTQKIADLDVKIESSLALNALTPQKENYELLAELTSLLSYPHPLNYSDELTTALLQHPKQSVNTVSVRFEIMLQPENYNRTNEAYEALDLFQSKLDKDTPAFTIENLFCSDQACEVQFKIAKPTPYFDSWRWLLDNLTQVPMFNSISESFSTVTRTEAFGLIIVALP